MKIKSFLDAFRKTIKKNNEKFATYDMIRIQSSLFCPIVYLANKRFPNAHYKNCNWREAANKLGLSQNEAHMIVTAADNRPRQILTLRKSLERIRNQNSI